MLFSNIKTISFFVVLLMSLTTCGMDHNSAKGAHREVNGKQDQDGKNKLIEVVAKTDEKSQHGGIILLSALRSVKSGELSTVDDHDSTPGHDFGVGAEKKALCVIL